MDLRIALFVGVVTTELLLLGGLVLSIVRPARRTWPPPGARSWQFAWSWGMLGVALVMGLVLGWLDRGTFVFDGLAWKAVATVLFLAAAAFNEWSVRSLGRHASRGLGREDLIARGPYRWSRNPQYLAQSVMVAAIAMFADSVLLAIAAALGIVCLLVTPLAEESWLEERYGEPYRMYRRRVPRFFGRRRGNRFPSRGTTVD